VKLRIWTGGQTGADQGALYGARAAGVETGGWAPDQWDTDAGAAPWLADYGLKMAVGTGYPQRTALNVKDATAMLWFGNIHSPGGKLTARLCVERNLETFVVVHESTPADVADWMEGHVFPVDGEEDYDVTLMVAGNRESRNPCIALRVETFVKEMLELLRSRGIIE
jgi:hypothetical protein